MGFFSRLFGTKVNDLLPGNSYMFRSTSGAMVNQRSAMQISAVYACVRVLAESIAGLPLHVYKCGKNGSREKVVEHPLYFLLHDEPNPEMTSFVFRETLMTHLGKCICTNYSGWSGSGSRSLSLDAGPYEGRPG